MREDSMGMQLVEDIERRIKATLLNHGVPEAVAASTAMELLDEVQIRWGGVYLYLPRGDALRLRRIHLEIYEAFKGGNYLPLARKHGYTERHIRNIVARVQAAERKARQGDMFPDAE